jgi:hypothetical protein
MTTLRSTCTIAALLLGATLAPAWAQTTTPGAADQPAAASPATPPTHPSMKDTPTTDPDKSTPTGKKASSLNEAKQVCKNLSGDQAQKECVAKAEQDYKKSSTQ